MLNKTHDKVFAVNMLSPIIKYVITGNAKYDAENAINLIDHKVPKAA
jgi:hypothetical protein